MQLSIRGKRCHAQSARPFRHRRTIIAARLLVPLVFCLAGHAALAQKSTTTQRPAWAQQPAQQKKVNDSSLMLLAGHPGTTYSAMARDIATAMGTSDELRVVAVDAGGGTDSVRDLLLLRGVDLALIPANALVHAKATAAFGPGLPRRLTYISQLYGEEAHILVGPGINAFENLHGKKIAVPAEDGNAEFTVRDLLRRLRIEADVVKVAAPDAIDDVRSGALGALVVTGGKPLRFVAGLPKDGSIRLLALPFTQAMGEGYSPSAFRSSDYPALVPDGQTIDTVAVAAVLTANTMAKSEDSYRRIAKFVPAFFGALSELAGPQWHPKWSEVNLAAPLAGWSRFATAEEWLAQTKLEQSASVQKNFEEFLGSMRPAGAPALSPTMRKALFEQFVQWTRKSIATPNQGGSSP